MADPGMEHEEDGATSTFSNIVAGAISILVIIIVVWGLAHLLSLSGGWFSSLFTPSGRTATTTSTSLAHPTLTSLTYTTPTPTPTRTASRSYPSYTNSYSSASPADLVVRILAVGVIDPVSGAFINRLPTSPSDMAAVQFDIRNDGGTASGVWYFTAHLPTVGGYEYQSPIQVSLVSGGRIVNTLRFTQVQNGGGAFSVTVDPTGMVHESDKTNNFATQFVEGPYYSY